MRANVAEYGMIAPPTLAAVLQLLADEPGRHQPMAGGTELMVALAAGQLKARRLISINHLRELRFISVSDAAVTIGAGTTFTDLRRNGAICTEFNLLAQAASWTGSIANQNRGTLGGNIVNASPAADSLPALLVYDATLELVSVRGMRTLAYSDFHLGYKRVALERDELVYAITLPRKFAQYRSFARKVGTRKAQAISKVAIAALARVEADLLRDVRIGAASLRETPIRCSAAEAVLNDQTLSPQSIAAARQALAGEISPIDDIRSTGRYRAAVAGNLLEEFLQELAVEP